MKIEKIELSTKATVTLINTKGEKFTQEVSLEGQFIVPPNFQESQIYVKKEDSKEAQFFKRLGS